MLTRLVAGAERLEPSLTVDVDRFEAPVRERAQAQATRTTELGAALRRLGADEVELRQHASSAGERLAAIDVELARTDAEHDEAQRRLAAANAEPAEGTDRPELAEKLDRYERRREQLGQVNPLAKEEYEAEKERLQELAVQRADLEASLDELEKLRDDLTKTVETRFAETFAAVETHFHEVAATLFPGGEGRLRMTEAEEDGEEPGIEVELRPAGKRVTRLSLLSGGEKALGAIAFLFSLFLARPSPFYLLDEVEAALDDTNIGRFTELLRTYADRAQFIVITHQKRTMEAADVLYGVTMGPDGVSQIVSRRLPRGRGRRDGVNDLDFVVRDGRPARVARSQDLGVRDVGRGAARARSRRSEHTELELLYPAPELAAGRRAGARLGRRRAPSLASARSSSRARRSSCCSSSAASRLVHAAARASGTSGRTTSSQRTAAPARLPGCADRLSAPGPQRRVAR